MWFEGQSLNEKTHPEQSKLLHIEEKTVAPGEIDSQCWNVRIIIGKRVNPCYKLFKIGKKKEWRHVRKTVWGLSWHGWSHDRLSSVLENNHMKCGRTMQMEVKEAMRGGGFSIRNSSADVCAKRQNNTGSSSGNKGLPLPNGNWSIL